MKLNMHEILSLLEGETQYTKKAEILKKHDSPTLRYILKLNFDPRVKFDLPKGTPPFKRKEDVPFGYADTTLFQEARRLYIFLTEKKLPKIKKEGLFIQMLEGLHYTEADLVIALKDKALWPKYRGLTEHIVRLAFPGLLPEEEKVAIKNSTASSPE